MVKQESILKKSKSTFKLFSSLANNSQHHHHKQQKSSKRHSTPGITANHSPTTTISSTASIARPKTTSTYSEYLLSLDTYNSSMYHSSSSTSSSIHSANSIKSQHSNESRLKLQSLASNNNNNTISTTGVTSNKEDSTLLSPHQSSLHRIASKAASVPNMVQPRYFSVGAIFI